MSERELNACLHDCRTGEPNIVFSWPRTSRFSKSAAVTAKPLIRRKNHGVTVSGTGKQTNICIHPPRLATTLSGALLLSPAKDATLYTLLDNAESSPICPLCLRVPNIVRSETPSPDTLVTTPSTDAIPTTAGQYVDKALNQKEIDETGSEGIPKSTASEDNDFGTETSTTSSFEVSTTLSDHDSHLLGRLERPVYTSYTESVTETVAKPNARAVPESSRDNLCRQEVDRVKEEDSESSAPQDTDSLSLYERFNLVSKGTRSQGNKENADPHNKYIFQRSTLDLKTPKMAPGEKDEADNAEKLKSSFTIIPDTNGEINVAGTSGSSSAAISGPDTEPKEGPAEQKLPTPHTTVTALPTSRQTWQERSKFAGHGIMQPGEYTMHQMLGLSRRRRQCRRSSKTKQSNAYKKAAIIELVHAWTKAALLHRLRRILDPLCYQDFEDATRAIPHCLDGLKLVPFAPDSEGRSIRIEIDLEADGLWDSIESSIRWATYALRVFVDPEEDVECPPGNSSRLAVWSRRYRDFGKSGALRSVRRIEQAVVIPAEDYNTSHISEYETSGTSGYGVSGAFSTSSTLATLITRSSSEFSGTSDEDEFPTDDGSGISRRLRCGHGHEKNIEETFTWSDRCIGTGLGALPSVLCEPKGLGPTKSMLQAPFYRWRAPNPHDPPVDEVMAAIGNLVHAVAWLGLVYRYDDGAYLAVEDETFWEAHTKFTAWLDSINFPLFSDKSTLNELKLDYKFKLADKPIDRGIAAGWPTFFARIDTIRESVVRWIAASATSREEKWPHGPFPAICKVIGLRSFELKKARIHWLDSDVIADEPNTRAVKGASWTTVHKT